MQYCCTTSLYNVVDTPQNMSFSFLLSLIDYCLTSCLFELAFHSVPFRYCRHPVLFYELLLSGFLRFVACLSVCTLNMSFIVVTITQWIQQKVLFNKVMRISFNQIWILPHFTVEIIFPQNSICVKCRNQLRNVRFWNDFLLKYVKFMETTWASAALHYLYQVKDF